MWWNGETYSYTYMELNQHVHNTTYTLHIYIYTYRISPFLVFQMIKHNPCFFREYAGYAYFTHTTFKKKKKWKNNGYFMYAELWKYINSEMDIFYVLLRKQHKKKIKRKNNTKKTKRFFQKDLELRYLGEVENLCCKLM